MKSNQKQLRQRGWVDQEELLTYQGYSEEALLVLLQSPQAWERTIGASWLAELTPTVVEQLLVCLTKEKKLYTKLAICRQLEAGTAATASQMLDFLGVIGSNQHRELPAAPSKKKGYPLPRDIMARSLGRMSPTILPCLLAAVPRLAHKQLRELLDAIGLLVFYHPELATAENYQVLAQLLNREPLDELLLWKLLTCLSAFPLPASISVLEMYSHREDLLGKEAQRSLRVMGC